MKTAVIINPNSQGGRLRKQWPDLRRVVQKSAGDFLEKITQFPGHATALVQEALRERCERIFAVGGDGTINECVNGFLTSPDNLSETSSFGILPFGTGGDFRRTIGLESFEHAARSIPQLQEVKCDVGLAETTEGPGVLRRYFINIASFGMSALVSENVNQSGKKLGRLSFTLASLQAAAKHQNQRVTLTFDDDKSTRREVIANTVAIGNAQYFGGSMRIAPNANPCDGVFQVVCMGDFGRAEALRHTMKFYKGTHLSLDKVTTRDAKTIYAESANGGSVLVELDGELSGHLPARFKILPQALRLLVPSKTAHQLTS